MGGLYSGGGLYSEVYCIGSTPTFLYFDLYCNTAYAAHYGSGYTVLLVLMHMFCFYLSPSLSFSPCFRLSGFVP